MSYKVQIELFKVSDIHALDFESSSSVHILNSFDQIDWDQQATLGVMEEYQGEFPFFEIEHTQSGRKIGGLFIAYTTNMYCFNCHTELYQKRQKSHFFGLFKSEVMPSFDQDDVPLDVFRNCLVFFLQGKDAEIEQLFKIDYPRHKVE